MHSHGKIIPQNRIQTTVETTIKITSLPYHNRSKQLDEPISIQQSFPSSFQCTTRKAYSKSIGPNAMHVLYVLARAAYFARELNIF